MPRNRQPTERPDGFRLNRNHPLAGSLAFAGLGGIGFGSTLYRDSSMYHNDCSLVSFTNPALSWSRAIGRPCLKFSGLQYVSGPKIPLGTGYGNPFSAALWFYSSSNNYQDIGPDTVSEYINFKLRADGTSVWYRTSTGDITYSSANWSGTGWHHLALVRRRATVNGNAYAYFDGVKVGTFNNNYANETLNQIRFSSLSYYFSGSLADCIISPVDFSDATIARLADPSNVMLDAGGGCCLIQAPRRQSFAVNSSVPVTLALSAVTRRTTCGLSATLTNAASLAASLKRPTAALSASLTNHTALSATTRRTTSALSATLKNNTSLSATLRRTTSSLSATLTSSSRRRRLLA